MSFYTHEERRAAKDHACDECRKGIKKGQRYQRGFGTLDGYTWTSRLCWRCARAWERMRARFGRCWNEDDGPSLGTLLDFVRSEHRPSDRREVAERRKKLGKTARWLRNGPRFVRLDRLVSCDPPGLVRDADGLPARLYL